MNKKKIINDPVYGFITIPTGLIYDLIAHPFFQRLRYIKQLGMSHLVYPGALHTRFHHALGAMHLMGLALDVLKSKGHKISEAEEEAAQIAILLHDIGHGPFSHALEHTIVSGIHHEDISVHMMRQLNTEFDGALDLALSIFEGRHPKKFLQQLICGQLDLDRLDYLNRDSYFTGVSEGVVSFDRIIKMFNVQDDELVIEEKGIYSVENFLISRRLMYWQVYLHKTSIAAEQMLVKILERAKAITLQGADIFGSPALLHFLKQVVDPKEFFNDQKHLQYFASLDDQDIHTAIKVWSTHEDKILSILCKRLISRSLYKVEMTKTKVDLERVERMTQDIVDTLKISPQDAHYFIFTDKISNRAYNGGAGNIYIQRKNHDKLDITDASDLNTLQSLDKLVTKHILCYARI